MFFVTRVQLTCLNMAPTYALCKRCWAMQLSRLLRYIQKSQQTVCGLFIVMRIREQKDEDFTSFQESVVIFVSDSSEFA